MNPRHITKLERQSLRPFFLKKNGFSIIQKDKDRGPGAPASVLSDGSPAAPGTGAQGSQAPLPVAEGGLLTGTHC